MSLQAMVWALEADVPDALAKLVLLSLANEASKTGHAAYPSQQTIAETVPCGIATVQRKLRDLEAAGLITRGDQELVTHYPSNRRPVVWDLPLTHHSDGAKRPQAHQTAPSRPITGPSAVMDNPTNPRDNPRSGVAARRETADGAVSGCALHRDRRRPACEDCTRVVPLHREQVKPADPGHAKAARAALKRTP